MFITEGNNFNYKHDGGYGEQISPIGEALELTADLQNDYLELVKPIAVVELYAYKNDVSVQTVLNEGFLSSLWEKIKKFFKAIYNKVKAFFGRILLFINKIFKDGQDFYSKYKDDFNKKVGTVDRDKVTFTIYDPEDTTRLFAQQQGSTVPNMDAILHGAGFPQTTDMTALSTLLQNANSSTSVPNGDAYASLDNLEEELEDLRGSMYQLFTGQSASGGLSQSDFASEFKEHFFPNKNRSKFSLSDISNASAFVMTALDKNKLTENTKRASSSAISTVERAVKAVDKANASTQSNNDIPQAVRQAASNFFVRLSAGLRTIISCMSTVCSVVVQFNKAYIKDAKTVMAAVIRGKSVVESVQYSDDIFGSLEF